MTPYYRKNQEIMFSPKNISFLWKHVLLCPWSFAAYQAFSNSTLRHDILCLFTFFLFMKKKHTFPCVYNRLKEKKIQNKKFKSDFKIPNTNGF